MDFIEYQGKQLLREAGLRVPEGIYCATAAEAEAACLQLGPCVIKAQVPVGKRGKAGGIELVSDPGAAKAAAQRILSMRIGDYAVNGVLVEQQADIQQEFYACVMTDLSMRKPLILFSAEGGMEIEELARVRPEAICRIHVDIAAGVQESALRTALAGHGVDAYLDDIVHWLGTLYELYLKYDAELLELNPLVLRKDGQLMALDCKLRIDDAAAYRQREWMGRGTVEPMTKLEAEAVGLGFKYIDLGGDVGILANGAGLTMTTMDVVQHLGGRPANFLEIGGEAYTKATPALSLVLSNANIKSLVVNFCGAFARTDVMTEGVIKAWEELKPSIPVFFSIHGTGEDEAVAMLTERLSIQPFDRMEDAVAAAVEATK